MAAGPSKTAGPSTAANPSTQPEDVYFPFIPTIWLMTAPSINPPKPPYLPNTAIHPIFSLRNCTEPIDPIHGIAFTPAQYDQLYPAFALASKFLTTASCLPWWVRLCLSTIAFDPPTSRHHLLPKPATLATLDATRFHLLHHAPRIRIRFAHPNQYHGIFAQTTTPTPTLLVITLHHDHLRYLSPSDGGNGLARASEPQRLCFFYHVAQLLLHETAHAFAHALPDAPRVEPFHDLREPAAEMGRSWENAAFGGSLQPLNGDRKVAKGLVWWRWAGERRGGHGDGADRMVERYWGVYMAWVEGLFREGTWRKVEALGLREIEMRTCGDRARSGMDEEGYWRARVTNDWEPF